MSFCFFEKESAHLTLLRMGAFIGTCFVATYLLPKRQDRGEEDEVDYAFLSLLLQTLKSLQS
jgi:hypothetical protein